MCCRVFGRLVCLSSILFNSIQFMKFNYIWRITSVWKVWRVWKSQNVMDGAVLNILVYRWTRLEIYKILDMYWPQENPKPNFHRKSVNKVADGAQLQGPHHYHSQQGALKPYYTRCIHSSLNRMSPQYERMPSKSETIVAVCCALSWCFVLIVASSKPNTQNIFWKQM